MGGFTKRQYLILALVLIFAFFWTYKRHLDYSYPYHHDEWQHLGLTKQIMAEGYNRQYNPFIGIPADHTDLEPGFHLFLSAFFKIADIDSIFFYKYLAAIFAFLATLSVFVCTHEMTKDYFISLSASLFFITLTTNVNILGKEFFVPLSMAFSMIFFLIYLLKKSIIENNNKMLMLSSFFYVILFLIHPPSALILIVPITIELLSVKGLLTKKMLFLLVPIGLVCILIFWKGNIISSKNYLFDLLFFERGWGKLEVSYFIPFLYGLLPTLIGVYGLFINFEKHKFFSYFAFISLGITTLFNLSGFTFLVPYSRAVHYSMLSLLLFTGIGLEKLTKKIGNYRYILLIILFATMLAPTYKKDIEFKNYNQLPLYDEDYEALKWIEKNFGQGNIIITPYFMTSAVYPVSGNKAISLIPAQMEGGLIEDNLNFFDYDCNKMKDIIIHSDADFVYSRQIIECDFLIEIYSGMALVYSVSDSL